MGKFEGGGVGRNIRILFWFFYIGDVREDGSGIVGEMN